MARFTFERPTAGARRIWLEREGRPPILLAPLAKHRKRFGDLYWWGQPHQGVGLTAATVAVHCGCKADVATFLARPLAEELFLYETRSVFRLDFEELASLILVMIEGNLAGLIEEIVGRGKAVRLA